MGEGRQAHPLDPPPRAENDGPARHCRARGVARNHEPPPPGAAPPRRHRVRFGGGRAAARARPPCPRSRQAARRGGAGVRHRVRVPRRVRVLPRDDLRRLHGRGRREGVLAVGGVHLLLRVLAHQARRRGPVDRQRLRPPRPRPRLLGGGGERPPPRRLLQKPGGDRRGDYPAGRGRHLEPDHEGRAPRARPPPPAPRMLVRERRGARSGRLRSERWRWTPLVLRGGHLPVVRRTGRVPFGDVEEHQCRGGRHSGARWGSRRLHHGARLPGAAGVLVPVLRLW